MRLIAWPLAAAAVPFVGACQGDAIDDQATGADRAVQSAAEPAGTVPGDSGETEPYDGIAADEVLRFTGTEPFWAGEVRGGTLTYKTPENQEGTAIAVERFAGRGGIAFASELEGAAFEMTVTPLECSDGMSDRTYPFTVTLKIGEELRNGCGWTDANPFEGPQNP